MTGGVPGPALAVTALRPAGTDEGQCQAQRLPSGEQRPRGHSHPHGTLGWEWGQWNSSPASGLFLAPGSCQGPAGQTQAEARAGKLAMVGGVSLQGRGGGGPRGKAECPTQGFEGGDTGLAGGDPAAGLRVASELAKPLHPFIPRGHDSPGIIVRIYTCSCLPTSRLPGWNSLALTRC